MASKSALYTYYVSIVFVITSMIFIPIMAILSPNRKWHNFALKLHNLWAWFFFKMAFIPVRITGFDTLDPKRQYIFCMNHFSYLDIPAFFLFGRAKFIGKSSLVRIPVFGYFFDKIHIAVNRKSAKSRAVSLQKSEDALKAGFNLSIFPEGGIVTPVENLPYMVPFKDGAFRLAAAHCIPIVPIVYHTNMHIMPDTKPFRFYRISCQIEICDPLYPSENSLDEVKKLKSATFEIIQNKLLDSMHASV